MKLESIRSILFKAIMSGLMIGVGGTVYLMCDNKLLGSMLFSFGLFTIIQCGFSLYTGKVGYIPENKPIYIREVAVTLVGNAIGTGLAALLVRLTRIGDKVHENAVNAMNTKMNDSYLSIFILGIFCGLLMYLAVDNGKRCRKNSHDVSFVFGTVIPVMVFILSGFNHSVADCFYFFAGNISLNGVGYLAIVALGNAVGGMLIPVVKKTFDKQ